MKEAPISKWRIRGTWNVIQISIDSFGNRCCEKANTFLSSPSSCFIIVERWNSIYWMGNGFCNLSDNFRMKIKCSSSRAVGGKLNTSARSNHVGNGTTTNIVRRYVDKILMFLDCNFLFTQEADRHRIILFVKITFESNQDLVTT